MTPQILLVGAGGHAKVVGDAIAELGWNIKAYVDPHDAQWLNCMHYPSDDAGLADDMADSVVIGVGGMTPRGLETRSTLGRRYLSNKKGPAVIDPRATVSTTAIVGDLAQVLVGSIVNAAAQVGEASIINTRAVVEHDATIGAGTHVGPGAIVLGGVKVGEYCMIGSGAVVLPGASVPSRTLVPAGSVYPN